MIVEVVNVNLFLFCLSRAERTRARVSAPRLCHCRAACKGRWRSVAACGRTYKTRVRTRTTAIVTEKLRLRIAVVWCVLFMLYGHKIVLAVLCVAQLLYCEWLIGWRFVRFVLWFLFFVYAVRSTNWMFFGCCSGAGRL